VNKLAEEQQHGRASLQAANAQVATLKAQLDRAVEQKVQKRLLKVCSSSHCSDRRLIIVFLIEFQMKYRGKEKGICLPVIMIVATDFLGYVIWRLVDLTT
jgi:hypothetical protein